MRPSGRIAKRHADASPNPRLGVSGAGQSKMLNHPNRSRTPTQYHEGQEVEVLAKLTDSRLERPGWRRAKILKNGGKPDVNLDIWDAKLDHYRVQFCDGTRAVFDMKHIRARPLTHVEQK
jgi:hypothetical protein